MTGRSLARALFGDEVLEGCAVLAADAPTLPADVLLIPAPDAAVLSATGPVDAHLADGGRAVVLDTAAEVLSALGWAGIVAQPMPPVAGPNPLVRAETVPVA